MSRRIINITGHRPHKLIGGYNHFSFENKMLQYVFGEKLKKELNKYQEVVCITGMAIGVDMLFAMACIELKETYGNRIKLIGAIPFSTQYLSWSAEHKLMWEMILSNCDGVVNTSNRETIYTHEVSDIMQQRNEWMVDNSDETWAVWDGSRSGTGKCVAYAKKQGKPVEIITTGLKQKGEL